LRILSEFFYGCTPFPFPFADRSLPHLELKIMRMSVHTKSEILPAQQSGFTRAQIHFEPHVLSRTKHNHAHWNGCGNSIVGRSVTSAKTGEK